MAEPIAEQPESNNVRNDISKLFVNIDGLDLGAPTEKRAPENKQKIVTKSNDVQSENIETKQIINPNLNFQDNPNIQQK